MNSYLRRYYTRQFFLATSNANLDKNDIAGSCRNLDTYACMFLCGMHAMSLFWKLNVTDWLMYNSAFKIDCTYENEYSYVVLVQSANYPLLYIHADTHPFHRRPKNRRQTRIHNCKPNINLIKRERVTRKIIIINGVMTRMSCTKSNLLSKVELWAEEEKSSP